MANYLTNDTDLGAVADAIRNKGGTSADLEFPQGFVDAVGAIETGGGDKTWYSDTGQLYKANMVIPGFMRYVRDHFQNATHLVSFIQNNDGVNLDSDYGLFRGCTSLKTVWVSRATFGTYCFVDCLALQTVTLGKIGVPVTSLAAALYGTICNIQTITCYVNATDMDGVPADVKNRILPAYSPNAVVTFLNSTTGELVGTMTNS